MNTSGRFASPIENRLLSALSPEVRSRLMSRMEKILLPSRQTLYDAGAPLTHVWFPLSGVVSLIIQLKQVAGVEIGTVGNEGFAGLPVFLGASSSPIRAVCQVSGQALRMRSDTFRRSLVEHPQLEDFVRRYTNTMLNQTSRLAVCNQVHSVRARLCRWLLMTQDRVGAGEFHLTQDLLAHTLAVRRPSVTIAAGLLRRDRLIDYQRGRVRVLNRTGLEAGACECYEALRQELDRAFGNPGPDDRAPRGPHGPEGFGLAPTPPASG